jgi:hypothetical protein
MNRKQAQYRILFLTVVASVMALGGMGGETTVTPAKQSALPPPNNRVVTTPPASIPQPVTPMATGGNIWRGELMLGATPMPAVPLSELDTGTVSWVVNADYTSLLLRDTVVYRGPATGYQAVTSLPRGHLLEVLGASAFGEDWLFVRYAQGQSGWVARSDLAVSPIVDGTTLPKLEASPLHYTHGDALTKDFTNVYQEPDVTADVVAWSIPPDSNLHIAGTNNDRTWALLYDKQGVLGWVKISDVLLKEGISLIHFPKYGRGNRNPYDWTRHQFSLGGQTHNVANADPYLREAGMSWVKVQVKWYLGRPVQDVADAVNEAHRRGYKVLIAMPGQEYPTTIDYASYLAFLAEVAALPTPPDAIEVWNEMNIDFEWPAGNISPVDYVEKMLKPAYTTIKSINPNIMVISGAPAPTGFNNTTNAWADERYIRVMAEHDAHHYADCIGVHYNAGATHPASTVGHPAGAFYGWYYLPSLSLYFNTFERAKPLCITEIGYLTADGLGKELPSRFWWGNGTTVDKQAEWLASAATLARDSGYVRLFIVFSMDIYHWGDDPQTGFAIVRPPLSNCPACRTLRQVAIP